MEEPNKGSLLTNFLRKKLKSWLSNYLKKYDLNKLNIGYNNFIEFLNVELKEDILFRFQVAMTVAESRIGKLSIKLNLPGNNSAIVIENVFIKLVSIRESKGSSGREDMPNTNDPLASDTDFKSQRIKDWENDMKKYFDEIKSESWVRKSVENLLQNVTLDLRRLVILVQNNEDESSPFGFFIQLNRLTIKPCNENWKLAYLKETEPRRKLINIDQLSVALFFVNQSPTAYSMRNASWKPYTKGPSSPRPPDGKGDTKDRTGNNLLAAAESVPVIQERNYIIHPFRCQIRLTDNKAAEGLQQGTPQLEVELLFRSSIVISACKEQLETILRFLESMNSMIQIRQNLHLRPLVRPTAGSHSVLKSWWKYIILAVIEKNRTKRSMFTIFEKYFLIRKYISLYKRLKKFVQAPWLPELKAAEIGTLQALEQTLTWQEIIKYREWALIELRIEAKRFVMSGIEVKPQNLSFTDIWVKCVDAEEIKMDTTGRNEFTRIEDIELDSQEKTALYEILATDKNRTLISFMNGEVIDEHESVSLRLQLEVSAIILIVTEMVEAGKHSYRELELAQAAFVNVCRCPACIEKKAQTYMERDPTSRRLAHGLFTHSSTIRDTSKDIRGKGFSDHHDQAKRGFGEVGQDLFGSHLNEVLIGLPKQDGNLTNPKGAQKKAKGLATGTEGIKEVRISDSKDHLQSNHNNLVVVCFFEVLDISGAIVFLKDGSLKTQGPATLGKIFAFDTQLFHEESLCELKNSPTQTLNTEENKASSVPLPKRFRRGANDSVGLNRTVNNSLFHFELSEGTVDLGLRGQDEFKDSRLLSQTLFECILRYVMADRNNFMDFFEQMHIKAFVNFMELYEKDIVSQEPSSKVDAAFYKPFMKYLSGDNPGHNLHLRAAHQMRDEPSLQHQKIRTKLAELYQETKKLFRCVYYPVLMKYYSLIFLPSVLSSIFDEDVGDFEQEALEQELANTYKVDSKGTYKAMLNPMKYLRGLKNVMKLFEKDKTPVPPANPGDQSSHKGEPSLQKQPGSSHAKQSNNSSSLPGGQKTNTIKFELELENCSDSVNIVKRQRDQTTSQIKNFPKRTISVSIEPTTLLFSYWSIKRLIVIVKRSLQSPTEKSHGAEAISNLKNLRDNLYQRPKVYMDNEIKQAIDSSIEIRGCLKELCLQLFEYSRILTEPQILALNLRNIMAIQKRLDPPVAQVQNLATYSKKMGALHQNSVKKYEICYVREFGVSHLSLHTLKSDPYAVRAPETTQRRCNLLLNSRFLDASVYCVIKTSLIQNSSMLIDNTIKAFIPYLNISVPTDSYHIAKILASFETGDSLAQSGDQPDAESPNSNFKLTPDETLTVAQLMNELSPVLRDIALEHESAENMQLPTLGAEHTDKEPHFCRHCIFKYRKVVTYFSASFGQYSDHFEAMLTAVGSELAKADWTHRPTQVGVLIKLPVAIDGSSSFLLEIPFLQIVSETGLFKKNLAVYVSKIQSRSRDKVQLSVKPYWAVKEPRYLFSPNSERSAWKRNLDIFKFLAQSDHQARGGEATKLDSFEQNHLDGGTTILVPDLDPSGTPTSGSRPEAPIFLVYFDHAYNNKSMLGYLDGILPHHVETFYKRYIMLRLSSVSLENNDMESFATLVNLFSMVSLHKQFEKFLNFHLRGKKHQNNHQPQPHSDPTDEALPPQWGANTQQTLRPVGSTVGFVQPSQLPTQRGANPSRTEQDGSAAKFGAKDPQSATKSAWQSKTPRYAKEDGQLAAIQRRLRCLSEFKQVVSLKETFSQLVLDASIGTLEVKISFEDTQSNTPIKLQAILIGLGCSINQQNLHRVITVELDGSYQLDKEHAESETYLNLSSWSLSFGEMTVMARNIAADYNFKENSFTGRVGWLVIEGIDKEEKRILQVGLDDPKISNELKYFAILVKVNFDQQDNPYSVVCDLKHSRLVVSASRITRQLKVFEIIKKLLYINKIRMFSTLKLKYAMEVSSLIKASDELLKQQSLATSFVLRLEDAERDQTRVSELSEPVTVVLFETLMTYVANNLIAPKEDRNWPAAGGATDMNAWATNGAGRTTSNTLGDQQPRSGRAFPEKTSPAKPKVLLQVNVRCHSISLLLQVADQYGQPKTFLRTDVTELMLDYLHSSGLNIGFEDLQMSPHGVIKKYQTLVSHLNVQKKHVIKVEMRDSDGSMMIRLSNLRVIILLRVIDEIIYFFDYISDASKQLNTELCSQSSIIGALENFRRERKRMIKGLEKTRQPTGDTDRHSDLQRPAHPDADKTNQPSKTYFELQDIELLFPQTSNSESYFRGHVTAGSAVIFSADRPFKVTATEAIKRLIRDKYLVEDLPEEKMTIESTVISGQIQQVTTFVHHEGDSGELSLGTIGEARYQVSIPEESDFRKWKIGPTIDVQVQSLRLNCKMGNLTKMIDVFELNSDEVSPLIRDSAKWYKNMDMNINIEKADMSLALSKIPQESARLSENEESPPLAQRRGPRAFQSQPLKSDPDDLSAKPH